MSVVAVGTNLSFPLWTRLAEREAGPLVPPLRAVRWIDKWVTIPSYLLSAATGALLVAAERIDPSEAWIAWSIALFALLMALGFLFYRPVSRRRLAAAAAGPLDAGYRRSSRQADALDAAILGAAVAILVLMTLRPGASG